MQRIAELLREASGSPTDEAARPGLWTEVSDLLEDLTVQDGHDVLTRAAEPFRPITDLTESIIWAQMSEPLPRLVLAVVGGNPAEDYVAPLVELASGRIERRAYPDHSEPLRDRRPVGLIGGCALGARPAGGVRARPENRAEHKR